MSRKGTLTGGYYDTRRSRLEMQRQMVEQRERLEAAEGERAQLRHQLDHILSHSPSLPPPPSLSPSPFLSLSLPPLSVSSSPPSLSLCVLNS